jgi:hypothetical protein
MSMKWIRSLLAIGGGVLVVAAVVTLYLTSSQAVADLLQGWMRNHVDATGAVTDAGIVGVLGVAYGAVFVTCLAGGLVAALLAAAHRIRHALVVGIIAVVAIGLWQLPRVLAYFSRGGKLGPASPQLGLTTLMMLTAVLGAGLGGWLGSWVQAKRAGDSDESAEPDESDAPDASDQPDDADAPHD